MSCDGACIPYHISKIQGNIAVCIEVTPEPPALACPEHFMQTLFLVCQTGLPAKWAVLIEGQPYGEYLDRSEAITDAVEAAKEAGEAGGTAEVWEGAVRLY